MDKDSILLESQDKEYFNGNQTVVDQSLKVSPLGHRREASRGLGIDTDCDSSKTNAFFHASNIPTPRPPPSISRKISIKQQSSLDEKKILHDMDTDIYNNNKQSNESYAIRLRNLVASTRHVPSTIPTYLNKKPAVDNSPTTPTYIGYADDEILALPTPIQCSKDIFTTKPIDNVHDIEYGQIIGPYQIHTLLGVGAFSHVYLANNIETNQLYAIKTILKGKLLYDARVRSSIEREISILKNIDHPNIVHMETTIETDNMMCLVLEYVEGGELFNYVQQMHEQLHRQEQKVNEDVVRQIFMQLVHAVKWLHEHNIVHRDLKLENILIHKPNDLPILKITDFGLARIVDPDSPLLTTRCGSEEYAAPEIVQSKDYDGRKSDVWALGIILYALLVGYLPFRYDVRKHERVSQLFYRIVRAEVKWPSNHSCYSDISEEAKEVVSKILERNPDRRLKIDEIEALDWFQ